MVDPAEPGVVFALTGAGPARSDDAGLSWQAKSGVEELDGQPLALAAGTGVLWGSDRTASSPI